MRRPEIVSSRVERARLLELTGHWFGDMVKYVVDVRRGIAAIGGELHADAEQVLLEDGSLQEDLWGANYYPGEVGEGRIEYTSLINIRPAAGNRSMEIELEDVRDRVREITEQLLDEEPAG